MMDAMTEADMRDFIGALVDKGKSGHVATCKLLLDRVLGKVVELPEPEFDGPVEINLKFDRAG